MAPASPLATSALPGIIETLQKAHPNLQIRATISKGRNIYEAILDDKIDLAVVEGNVSGEYDSQRTYSGRPSKTDSSAGTPINTPVPDFHERSPSISPADERIRQADFWTGAFRTGTFAMHGLSFIPTWESASTQALVHGVSRGLGIAILPEQLVAADIRAGNVVSLPVADEAFIRKNYLIWHKQKYLTKIAQEFIHLCRNETSL